jgi:hypothetical protein
MQAMGQSQFLDNQYLYMQPGMINPQFIGYDGNQQVLPPQFPMGTVDMQQQYFQQQMPQFMGQ